MRADGSFCKPDEWWDSNPKHSIKAVESGSADSLKQHLDAELYPHGIVIDIRSIKAGRRTNLLSSRMGRKHILLQEGCIHEHTNP